MAGQVLQHLAGHQHRDRAACRIDAADEAGQLGDAHLRPQIAPADPDGADAPGDLGQPTGRLAALDLGDDGASRHLFADPVGLVPVRREGVGEVRDAVVGRDSARLAVPRRQLFQSHRVLFDVDTLPVQQPPCSQRPDTCAARRHGLHLEPQPPIVEADRVARSDLPEELAVRHLRVASGPFRQLQGLAPCDRPGLRQLDAHLRALQVDHDGGVRAGDPHARQGLPEFARIEMRGIQPERGGTRARQRRRWTTWTPVRA